MSKEESNRYIRNLASRAARLSTEDCYIPSFSEHEKTIIDNMEFLYWMVKLAKLDEREACAKICEDLELPFVADAIHARKNK